MSRNSVFMSLRRLVERAESSMWSISFRLKKYIEVTIQNICSVQISMATNGLVSNNCLNLNSSMSTALES